MGTRSNHAIICWCVVGLILLSGCNAQQWVESEQPIHGRWKQISSTLPSLENQVPMELLPEIIEFRDNGLLIDLMLSGEQAWLTNSASYSIPNSNQIKVTGSCFRGWERYSCTRTYRLSLVGEHLTIYDRTQADRKTEFVRIGALSPNLPPTLVPPFASPAPAS